MKFGPYNNVVGQSTNANDIPLMRIEEMYLIKAEAEAMGGNPSAGKSTLNDFVKTYRDPEYTLPLQIFKRKSIVNAVSNFGERV